MVYQLRSRPDVSLDVPDSYIRIASDLCGIATQVRNLQIPDINGVAAQYMVNPGIMHATRDLSTSDDADPFRPHYEDLVYLRVFVKSNEPNLLCEEKRPQAATLDARLRSLIDELDGKLKR